MKHRSLFWPFAFIGAGIIWLLIELHTIPSSNLWALMYIWPFVLMAAGIGLILRSRWPVVRMFVSAFIAIGIALSIVFAPQLGWNKAPAWNFFTVSDFGGSIRGSGVVVSQPRTVADFNAIEVNFPAELTVQQGDTPSLTVEAENNVLPQLATRVSGGKLYIENSEPNWAKRVNPTRTIKIRMTVKDLQQVDFPTAGTILVQGLQTSSLDISINGAGTVTLNKLNAGSLHVNLSGAGNISADGSANDLSVDISGFGGFQGGSLASQSANVTISGAGSATVWAKTSLQASISGTGSVSYFGSPQVQQNISGLGSVNKAGDK